MPKFIRLFVLLITVYSSLFTLASIAHARQCNLTPEYKGPFNSLLFKEQAADDCANIPTDSSLWEDFIDNAVVSCVDKPELVGEFVGANDLLPQVSKSGQGSAELGIKNISNLSISPDTLSTNHRSLFRYLPAFTYTDQADTARFTKDCLFYGLNNPDACASLLGICLPSTDGSCQVNSLVAYSNYQKSTTQENQFWDRYNFAKFVEHCSGTNTAPDDVLCSNLYTVKANNPDYTSLDIAKKILSVGDYNTFLNLPSNDQAEIMSLQVNPPLWGYLVIQPVFTCSSTNPLDCWLGWLSYRFSDYDTIYVRYTVPAAAQLAQEAERRLKKYSQLDAGQQAWNQIKQATYKPVTHAPNTEEAQLLEKIDQYINEEGLNCNNIRLPKTSFSGGVVPSRSQLTLIEWLFSILQNFQPSTPINHMVVWTAYNIFPGELSYIDDVSVLLTQMLYTVGTQNINQYISLLLPAQGKAPSASTEVTQAVTGRYDLPHCDADGNYCCDAGYNYLQVTDDDGNITWQCQETTPISIIYAARKALNAESDGGSLNFLEDLNVGHKNSVQLSSAEHSGDSLCYFQWAAQTLAAAGVPITSAEYLNTPPEFLDNSCANPPMALTEGPPTETDGVKQHLFETTCGGTPCYEYILNRVRNEGSCNGKVLNPYYAIAIALNENGGLVSCKPGGQDAKHFGCDIDSRAGYNQTIESKTSCMLNTLVNKCRAGMSDADNLAEYGYPPGYTLWPLGILNSPTNNLFVGSSDASSYASALTTLLPTQKDLWWKSYCSGYIQPYAQQECGQTITCP